MSTPFNRVKFTPVAAGTVDFVVAAAVVGYSTPAQRGIPDGTVLSYTAESSDRTEWETGIGTYTAATTTLSRTTVLENSLGTTANINFTLPPFVWIDWHSQQLSFYQSAVGEEISLTAGAAPSSNTAAADIHVNTSAGNNYGRGGHMYFNAGTGGANGQGGSMYFKAGYGYNAHGGYVDMFAGKSIGRNGGSAFMDAGNGDGKGGKIYVRSGRGKYDNGGDFTFKSGYSVYRHGGYFYLTAGFGASRGGGVVMHAGNCIGASGSYRAGPVSIYAGNAFFGAKGGDIFLSPGTGSPNGNLLLSLPTTDPAISNAVWSNNNVLTLSGAANFSGTITTGTLVGKTITVVNGIITSFV